MFRTCYRCCPLEKKKKAKSPEDGGDGNPRLSPLQKMMLLHELRQSHGHYSPRHNNGHHGKKKRGKSKSTRSYSSTVESTHGSSYMTEGDDDMDPAMVMEMAKMTNLAKDPKFAKMFKVHLQICFYVCMKLESYVIPFRYITFMFFCRNMRRSTMRVENALVSLNHKRSMASDNEGRIASSKAKVKSRKRSLKSLIPLTKMRKRRVPASTTTMKC